METVIVFQSESECVDVVRNSNVVVHQSQSGKAQWETTSELAQVSKVPIAENCRRVVVVKEEVSGFSGRTLNIRFVDLPEDSVKSDIMEKLLDKVCKKKPPLLTE